MRYRFAPFKYDIGYTFTTFGRNLEIIDREYRLKDKVKNGKIYSTNEKWYRYRCNVCGNEEWIYEYCLGDYMKTGCNVCGKAHKKVAKGVNDISVTAPWMLKYFANPEDANGKNKSSRDVVLMKCPDCGRIQNKQIYHVYANRGLACACKDSWSYPNKFMYALLEQLGVNFCIEKVFPWSENRVYDDYIEFNGLKIITEQHGKQHYDRPIGIGNRYRTVAEEVENDRTKYELALNNGIDYYFTIDCSESNLEHIRRSIINSGLLEVLNANVNDIDWEECGMFATSNFAKKIAEYKRDHPTVTLHEIAEIFKISYVCVLRYVTIGNKYGWCNYQFDDLQMLRTSKRLKTFERPVFCHDTNCYYRNANVAAESITTEEKPLFSRQLRKSIERGQKYKGYKFSYITQAEFNRIKTESPNLCVGDYFVLPQGDNNG